MISINKQGNAIVIEFTDNDKYLFNGKIEVAPNELIVVVDQSDMVTFKRASNGDVLFSQLVDDIQIAGSPVTKDTIIDQFAIIGFTSGGGGGTSNWDDITGKPEFAEVATTGSYNDLTNKPEIPSDYIENITDSDTEFSIDTAFNYKSGKKYSLSFSKTKNGFSVFLKRASITNEIDEPIKPSRCILWSSSCNSSAICLIFGDELQVFNRADLLNAMVKFYLI